ncbi:MAG: Holliday junction resolvase RuvX [Chloroflexi bacterium]|nr:Holliday junction resolvase RuvX [Chloroflexota bacterium]MDA1173526.1 Holliday junction resolvase RuvX [Chloroflexota bacterium]
MRALGLDVGEVRIGVSTGDTESHIAVTVGTIDRTELEADLTRIAELAAEREAEVIVVGMPLSMNGRVGPQAEVTLAFIDVLAERTQLTIDTIDERLTSVEAERRIRQSAAPGRGKRGRPAKGSIDAGAAVLILQAWLDRR